MEVTERFSELVSRPDAAIPLDEIALLVAAHDHPVDVDAELCALDELAASVPSPDAGSVAELLFGELGFAGNSVDYGDPRNSYLDEVRSRRLGIPITLSVLMLEVGRRAGVALAGVGMPGHFLVRTDSGVFFDPFHGGARLDAAGCAERFAAIRGDTPFRPEYLDPVGTRAIVARMLGNLVNTFVRREPASAVWAVRLRLCIPGLAPAERRQAADILGTLGRFAEAAAALESIARDSDGDTARNAARDAARLRSRAN